MHRGPNLGDVEFHEAPRLPVVATRWALIGGIAAAVLLGAVESVPFWPHQALLLVLLASNVVLQLVLRSGVDWKRIRWFVTAVDVVVVMGAVVLMAGNRSTDIYLVAFTVLLVATVLPRIGAIAMFTVAGTFLYSLILYNEHGLDLFRSEELLVRMPLMVCIAVYFGTVVHEARMEQVNLSKLGEEARYIAQRAKYLAKERYRLQALSEIGRLGLSGVRDEPGKVLFEIIQRVQKVLGVDRASLVVFERDAAQAYLAASGDDPSVEVRVLALEDYPELQAMLHRGEITELHPGRPRELWRRVQECLPPANPFRAFLIVPIQRGRKLLGAIYMRDVHADHVFTEEDRNFCWTAAMMTAAFIHGQDLLEALRNQSRRDGLTGLLNFQAFTQEAGEMMSKARERGERLSLVVADLDNLKEVNDRLGHMAGNRLIVTAGHAFAQCLDDTRNVCRYGGDEFVAMVRGSKELTGKRLRRFLDELSGNKAELPSTPRVSVGVAQYPEDGKEFDKLLDAADQAMYLAKNDGGHRIYMSGLTESGMDSEEYQRAVLEAVVQVQARRYAADDDRSLEEILAPLANATGASLDSDLVRDTLERLMESVEARDPHTRAHSEAVASLARQLAEALDLPEAELTQVEIAGLVHDVGKIGVPEDILTKKGKLTNIERQVMERHPEIAAELLSNLPPLEPVVPLVAYHQERWDGSGYPEGLKGEEIPTGAQVVALADAYNALTSPRSYRSPLRPHEARAILERDAGRLWNPRVVQVFFDDVIAAGDPGDEAGGTPPAGPDAASRGEPVAARSAAGKDEPTRVVEARRSRPLADPLSRID